jgi:uncharacterized protein (DUF1330 family)
MSMRWRLIGHSQHALITEDGGRLPVRGGVSEIIEGGPSARTLIIVELPSMAGLREWYGCPTTRRR